MNLPNEYVLQNGKYRITHTIGQGGFGITYKGVWYTEVKGSLGTVKTEVPICIKEYFFKDYCYRDTNDSFTVKVHSETGRVLFNKFKEKLIKEAKILSEVHHPHIVNVLEVFEENGTAYIAMEYISGCSLKSMMDREGVLPEAKVLRYVHQIGEALQFVHEKNILHLDIKPSNILIDSSGKARLIDFGVSKRYDVEQQETSTTMLTLSKGFASIEQYDNEGIQNFSPCPDIYSLGATMYNLLTGKIPTESILRATRPLLEPTKLNKDISSKTEAVIIKAMQIIPADRFQTITEMMAALDFPAEEEETNLLTEKLESDSKEDETTVLNIKEQTSPEEEDEQTIIRRETISSFSNKKKSKGKLLLIPIFVVTIICSGVILLLRARGNKIDIEERVQVDSLLLKKNPVDSNVIEDKQELFVEKKVDTSKINQELKQKTEKAIIEKKVDVKENTTKKNDVQPQPEQHSVQDIETKYATLILSGKEKMENADFINARLDFTKAKEIKLTEEVIRLLITCDEEEAIKQLADRKAQYEIKKTFGNFMIVRKKSTKLYGAIDEEAKECIPCIYLNVGITDNGRAFERKDGLFDIYNAKGILINEGVTYY